ncbi:unnamed protein product, partial [Mesorhabditis spiculigera]
MILLLLGILAIWYLWNQLYWKRRGLPPGPTPFGPLGNMPEVIWKLPGYEAFRRWGRKYGPVHTFWLGPLPVIAITDYKTLKETIVLDGEKYSEFDTAVGSITNNLLLGYRFDEDRQDEFRLVKGCLRELSLASTNPMFILAALVAPLQNIQPFKAAKREKVDYDSPSSSDFVEAYLKEWERKKGTDQEAYFFDLQFGSVVFDLWAAGLDTTTNTLNWAVCYVLNHPEVQEKLHEELDRVIQADRKITVSDKNNLPYVNAVVNEVQRLANLLPQNIFRSTNAEVNIGGYKLPAGTVVCPQLSTVLYDEEIFPEPYKFKPERFINTDGSLKKFEELIPFSLGKRQCVGEGLARLELYLFVANIFQRFKVPKPPKLQMWLVPLLFTIASYVNAFLSLHHYTQCLVRPLRVGDVITIKGHVIAGAEQWKCSISLQGMNHVIIHADHRITTGRGNPCTVLNSRFRTEWGEEYVKDIVPFSGGPFQMTFRILEELMVEVYYKDVAWPGTSYAR